jgi:glutamate/aspartate transport system substrate-binding protein
MNSYRYGRTLAGLLAGLLLAAGQLAAAPVREVRIMAQESLAPTWNLYPDHVEGICPDIIAAMERAEPRLRFYGYAHGRTLPAIVAGLGSGEVQAACGLMDSAPRRAVAEPMGKPLYHVSLRLAARAGDDARVDALADLVRLHALVNVVPGSALATRLRAAGVAVDESSGDTPVMLRKLLAGHGRFSYMNEMTLERQLRDTKMAERIRVLPLRSEEPEWLWVSRKADPQVRRLIEGALERVRASGQLGRIYARWSRRP